MRLIRSLAVVALLTGTFADAAQRGSGGWSDRGLFVFQDIVFDFQRELWAFGPITAKLLDCSDKRFFCADVSYMSLVLPRKCGKLQVGQQWSTQSVVSAIVGERRTSLGTNYLVGTPGSQWFLYDYDANHGVVGVYFDVERKIDFLSAANGGKLEQQKSRYFRLVTPDTFGACRTSPQGG